MNKNFTYKNQTIDKKQLRKIILWAFTNYGISTISNLVDKLKSLGFYYATEAGLSLSLEDLKIPPEKTYTLKQASNATDLFTKQVERAELTEVEKFQRIISTWNQTSENLKNQVINYFKTTDPLNSIYIMAFSGARGNIAQVRQLVGMRGLMADPNGEIIDLPILANFREGLKITDYLISSFGARKGLVDTALKTADSGYLTRRLVDVAQDIIIRELSCQTQRGIHLKILDDNFLSEQLVGRILAEDLILSSNFFLKKGDEITFEHIEIFSKHIPFNIYIYSPLTCLSIRSTCQRCYGWNLATNRQVSLGEAVGVLAAQSIGEPGTQLTMRTFHTGGVFTGTFLNHIRAQVSGQILYSKNLNIFPYRTEIGQVAYVTQNSGEVYLKTYNNEYISISIPRDTELFIPNFAFVKENSLIGEIRSKNENKAIATKKLVSSKSGKIYYEDISPNIKKSQKILDNSQFKSTILWLLEGELCKIPFNYELKMIYNKVFLENQILAETRLRNQFSGFLKKIDRKENTNQNNFNNIVDIQLSPLNLSIFPIVKKQAKVFPVLGFEFFGSFLKIGFIPKQISLFQYQNNFPLASTFTSLLGNENNIFVKKNSCFWNKKKKLVNVEQIQQISTSSIIVSQINEIDKKVSNKYPLTVIHLTPELNRRHYKVHIKNLISDPKIFDKLLKFESQIFYPGEYIFRNLKIRKPYIIEKLFNGQKIILILKPLQIYHFSFYEIKLPNSFLKLSLQHKIFSLIDNIKVNASSINIQFDTLSYKNLAFELNCSYVQNNNKEINFLVEPREKIIPRKNENLLTQHYFKNAKFVGTSSHIYASTILSESKQTIKNWRLSLEEKNFALFFNTTKNYHRFYSENKNFSVNPGDFIFKNSYLNSNFKAPISGQVKSNFGNYIDIHQATPYLFSKNSFLFVEKNDCIGRNTNLGLFLFEKTTTGDIVQGLPKVEEVLEARKIQQKGRLTRTFGLFLFSKSYKIMVDQKKEESAKFVKFFETVFLTKIGIQVYRRLTSSTIDLEVGDFISLNFQIKQGLNLHKLLYNSYKYFSSFNSMYEACYRSLRKIQVLIVSSIQQVYDSQGVSIADKHVELIVRQMTSKVQVANPGKTSLKCGEILDLGSLHEINKFIFKFTQQPAGYIPVLYGITRASLKTDSFISAASFQETTKVLTQSAVEGKMDWLRGLKENVIVGRLIPAGTGFNIYNSLVHENNFHLPFNLKQEFQ